MSGEPIDSGLYEYDVVADHDKPRRAAYTPIATGVVMILDDDGEWWTIELSRGFPALSHRPRTRARHLVVFPEVSNAVAFRTVPHEVKP